MGRPMIKDVVWCINDYVHGVDGNLPNATHARCPVCHKIIFITRNGTLRKHGVTRKKLAMIADQEAYESIKRGVEDAVAKE